MKKTAGYLTIFDFIRTHRKFYKYELFKSKIASYAFTNKVVKSLVENGCLIVENGISFGRRVNYYTKTDKFDDLDKSIQLFYKIIKGADKND
jgi:hypothetical protein